ncbi:MAG: zinc ABC transporter substrate-binding protein [Pseudomonas marincola]
MKNQIKKIVISFGLIIGLASQTHSVLASEVIVTIPPLHSLVQGVMGNTGKAILLIQNDTSPHDYQLKPSVISLLHKAKIVFYISDSLEISVVRALDVLPQKVRKVPMIDRQGVTTFKLRADEDWEKHDHATHSENDGTVNRHQGHEEHHDVEGTGDPHIWLDPNNAIVMIKAITRELSIIHPENRSFYKVNALSLISNIEAIEKEIETLLVPIKGIPFIVFHDAYQYFEKHYNLTAVGSIVLNPSHPTSVKRIKGLRRKVKKSGAVCIFREPQFSNKLSILIADETNAKLATIDPIGADLKPGADLYPSMLMGIARSLRSCLLT